MLVSLGQPARIWAIPAILGHASKLVRVHNLLFDAIDRDDRLIYLGNYMGYGPDVDTTLDEVLQFRHRLIEHKEMPENHIVHLRGAQEEMWVKLLQIQWAMLPDEAFDWMMAHGVEATLRAYGGHPGDAPAKFRAGVVMTTRWTSELRENFTDREGHYPFIHGLASAAYTQDRQLLFASAGVDPSKPLDQQNDAFWWGSARFEGMSAPFDGFRTVVRGFDSEHRGIAVKPPLVSLDGGCGFGGELIATCLSSNSEVLEQSSAAQ
jgi:serine/threonine protein phosphatase 1